MQMGQYPPPTVFPSRSGLPVLLSVPHAGREYDRALIANACQGLRALETLEDPLVDRLVWRTIAAGIGGVIQPVPRAAIDCNRDEDEVDPAAIAGISPAPVGHRARHGLGLVPSRTHRHGALWRRPIDRAELVQRLDQVHRPYHHALERALGELSKRHEAVLLIDCHSMPARKVREADIVVGDLHGRSAPAWLGAEACRIARTAGFRAALNDPYAGGAIVGRHGRPADGIYAIQLEIDRSTYLVPDSRTPGVGFDRIAVLIATLASELGEALVDRAIPHAAE